MRQRLDQEMVLRGLVPTRSRARDLVRRRGVLVNGVHAEKPSQSVSADHQISVCDDSLNYVSRGALKLLAGLEAFSIDAAGRVGLDIGSSTGGFSDVLLQAGAVRVFAVDVGRDQLAEKIRQDDRVVVLEQTDARQLSPDQINQPIDIVVVDVSFISLTKVLPGVLKFAAPGCRLVALVKPQFEVGPEHIGKGGIVRDEGLPQEALAQVVQWMEQQDNWFVEGTIPSPITGGSGNKEFVLGARFDGA